MCPELCLYDTVSSAGFPLRNVIKGESAADHNITTGLGVLQEILKQSACDTIKNHGNSTKSSTREFPPMDGYIFVPWGHSFRIVPIGVNQLFQNDLQVAHVYKFTNLLVL